MLRSRTAVLVVALSIALVLPATAQEGDDASSDIAGELERAREREERVRSDLALTEEQIREATADLVAIQARLRDAQGRLRQLEGQLALAEEEHAAAEERTRAAERRLATALQRLDRTEELLGEEQRTLREQVVNAYKYGSAREGAMFLRVIQDARTPTDVAVGMYTLRSIVSHQNSIVDRVDLLRRQHAAASAEADAHREEALQGQRETARALAVVTELRDDAVAVADAIAADEERQSALLASLESDQAAHRRVLEDVAAEQLRLEQAYEQEMARRRAAGAGVCPVDGARVHRDFRNDWGYPRPGERRHEGTDIFADRGTPVRAMYHGTVKEIRTVDGGIGGRFVSYWVGGGEHWYNAHLETVADGLRVGDPVAPGTLLGTVGNSGNARTTPPHLHIGRYIDDVAENPYPILAESCP